MNPLTVIKKWLVRVKQPRKELNGKSVCPFATMPSVVVVDKLTLNNVKPIGTTITMYVENTVQSSFEDIDTICQQLKKINQDYIFLPDHPEKKNYINGVETGNGHLPIIIVQLKKELLSARRGLEKTDYYDHWDKKYLDEIKSYGD